MLIDISQEVFSCRTYPGDPPPRKKEILSIPNNDICNLTAFSMCAHNGTHIDVPYHFIENGKSVEQVGVEPFVGDCFVAHHTGNITADAAADIL